VDGLLVASMASYLAYSVFLLGYGVAAHPDWPPAAIGRMTDILYFLTAAASLGFHRALLGRMRPARGALLFTDLLIGGAVLALLAYLLGFAAQSFAANSAVVLLGTLALPAMALTARESADPPLRLIRLIYALFALLQAAAMLLNFGFIPAISLLLYAVEIQGLLNGLLVLALVVSRTWSMQRKHAAWKARLQDAEMRRAVAARSADLKDKLLNMLAHEVRNHLAIIRIAAEAGFGPGDRQQALAVTRDLETTINDCIRLAWLERGDLAVRAGNCDLVTVLLEALAETLDEDRIDLSGTEAQAILPHDGAFLGIALGAILRAADAALPPDAPIRIAITRHRPSGWRVAIAATGPARWPERWDPERDATPDGASLALAIASGMITLIEGTATFHQREDGIACQLYLPASSTSS
jgi:signal transduction histidine kinase